MNSSNRTDAALPSADYRSKRRIRILATFGFLSIALIVDRKSTRLNSSH